MSNNTPDYEDNLYFDTQNTKKDLCITVEKQVWESTLHRSMVLQAENDKLKEVIHIIKRQCEFLMPKNGLNPVGDRAVMKAFLTKIDEALR